VDHRWNDRSDGDTTTTVVGEWGTMGGSHDDEGEHSGEWVLLDYGALLIDPTVQTISL